jgi:hypothetical protein
LTLDAGVHPVLDRSSTIRQAAERLGFDCLDEQWEGWQARYRFHCREGHVLTASLRSLLAMSACRRCREAESWQHLLDEAKRHGVDCLDKLWKGVAKHYRFRCSVGHESTRSGRYAQTNVLCTRCLPPTRRQKRQAGLARLQEVLVLQAGTMLVPQGYCGLDWHYRFRCASGHEWKTNARSVLNGSWCPTCAREKRQKRHALQIFAAPDQDSDAGR